MWSDLIAKSKEGGADVIQTYAFWSGHEPQRGQVCSHELVPGRLPLVGYVFNFSFVILLVKY